MKALISFWEIRISYSACNRSLPFRTIPGYNMMMGHGHTDEILYDTMELVWLNAVYRVDLNEYAYYPGYISDIRAIAKSIMDGHDPA